MLYISSPELITVSFYLLTTKPSLLDQSLFKAQNNIYSHSKNYKLKLSADPKRLFYLHYLWAHINILAFLCEDYVENHHNFFVMKLVLSF